MSTLQSATSSARRKPPADRRQEIIDAASAIALEEGLTGITARRVAGYIGVGSGLVTHYFSGIDELVSAAFSQVVSTERDAISEKVAELPTATERLRATIACYTTPSRDPLGLLWLDAWRQAADRPAIRAAVVEQMELDLADMKATIEAGAASGEFDLQDPSSVVAMRVLALLDGQVAASAVRGALVESSLDYPAVEGLLAATTERELGLPAGALS
ncbi:MAG: TetR family transcriptional regulator [Leifsonia sp.]